jgi:hypothetical protein
MPRFQHAIHLNPYGVATFGADEGEDASSSDNEEGDKNAASWTKLVEAGAGLVTTGVMSYTGRKAEEKRRKADLAYQKKMASIEGKKAAAQAKLYEAQAKLAAAQKPKETPTPPWVWAVAGVGGLAVIGVIVLAVRK